MGLMPDPPPNMGTKPELKEAPTFVQVSTGNGIVALDTKGRVWRYESGSFHYAHWRPLNHKVQS